MGFPIINGNDYSYSSVEVNVNRTVFTAVKDINYSHALEPGEMRGTAAQALGRTRGEYKPEGSISIFLAQADYLINQLGDGYGEVAFDIVVSYQELYLPLQTHVLRGCRIKKDDRSNAAGSSDPTVVKFDLSVMYILINGKAMVRNLLKG